MSSALDTLRAISASVHSHERNETNEQTPHEHPPTSDLVGVNSLNSFISSYTDNLDEPAAIIEYNGNIPRAWAEGFAALCAMPAPTGFSVERWRRIIDAAGTFLDKWAARAIECGWSDLDVFGCDPDRPDARFDCMGLVLLLDRCEVAGIDRDGADLVTVTGARQRYRLRPMPPGTVSLWQLCMPRDPAA
jgi:hypothetical protein